MDQNLAKLKYWMTFQGNTFPKLAHLLGYSADNTIRMWFDRGHIPGRELSRVMEIIDGDIIESSKTGKNSKTASSVTLRN